MKDPPGQGLLDPRFFMFFIAEHDRHLLEDVSIQVSKYQLIVFLSFYFIHIRKTNDPVEGQFCPQGFYLY
jgi:hypothetical protein